MKRRAIPAISLALVVLFSASFLLALPGAVSMPASAVTQAEIDALKESARRAGAAAKGDPGPVKRHRRRQG